MPTVFKGLYSKLAKPTVINDYRGEKETLNEHHQTIAELIFWLKKRVNRIFNIPSDLNYCSLTDDKYRVTPLNDDGYAINEPDVFNHLDPKAPELIALLKNPQKQPKNKKN